MPPCMHCLQIAKCVPKGRQTAMRKQKMTTETRKKSLQMGYFGVYLERCVSEKNTCIF